MPWAIRFGMLDVATAEIASTCLLMSAVSSTFAASWAWLILLMLTPERSMNGAIYGTSTEVGVEPSRRPSRSFTDFTGPSSSDINPMVMS